MYAWADLLVDGVERLEPVVVAYKADGRFMRHEDAICGYCIDESWNLDKLRWRPPVTMPRWASRFTFEVFGVECRRVQYIGLDELKAGGIKDPVSVSDVWNRHYAKRGLGWDANQWAWFARVRRVEG